jgi:ribose 5-phosphate isomerase B
VTIAIGSDHRGYGHKAAIVAHLRDAGVSVEDCGAAGPGPSDYPDPAFAVGGRVAAGVAAAGVLICGSGNGVCIAANKVRGVRAALCFTEDQARATRRHNDCNVLCLSGDALDVASALRVVDAWLAAAFEAGRHQRRVEKITAYEASQTNGE